MKIENLKELKEDLKDILTNLDKNIDSLYHIATHDEKTGLYNYKFFQNILDMEFERARRGNKLSLMILDLDNFKAINTKLGHIKADKILVRVARTIESQTRKSDIVARFGGEEFIILLPDTNLQKAKLVGERIRKSVSNLRVTISGGISEYTRKDSKISLKEKADKALYKAKNSGKNKICC